MKVTREMLDTALEKVRSGNFKTDTNPKTQYGLAKPGLKYVPPVPLYEIGRALAVGAAKYGPMNWRLDPVTYSTYYEAALRHMMAAWDGANTDLETGINNLAHAASNLVILMDAMAQGTLIDDRPHPGTTTTYLAKMTKPITGIQNAAHNSSNP